MNMQVENETLKITGISNNNPHVEGETLVGVSDGNTRYGFSDGTLYITTGTRVYNYIPRDWRAELYMQGLTKLKSQQRPDMYEQELLDLFDSIYNMREQKFKTNKVGQPNDLNYFLDYIEPVSEISQYSINALGNRTESIQEDKIIKLYNEDVPNNIILNIDAPQEERKSDIRRCELEGQSYSNVDNVIYEKLAIGTIGYTAQEKARDLLYQHTHYNETISLQAVPIYHLDVNSRITVKDSKSGINGDYVINSMTLPLDAKSNMSISASKVVDRI